MKAKNTVPIGIFATALAVSASAFNMQNVEVAQQLGSDLAAESFCSLEFDHYAIDTYVDANIDHSSMGFASYLAGGVGLPEMLQKNLIDAAKRANCRAIEATARFHRLKEGLI